VREKKIDEFGLITAAGALGDYLLHGREPMVVVQRDGILRHRHHPDRKFYRVARETPRQSFSVPPLVDLTEIFSDRLWQTDTFRDPLRDFAMPGQDGDVHLRSLGKTAL
jgi:hypothetical protein